MRRYGIGPSDVATQAQKPSFPQTAFQPLPAPTGVAPFRLTTQALEVPAPAGAGRVLHVIGDSGGIKDPAPQAAVAAALVADLKEHDAGWMYHLGDVDYFNGELSEYVPQFFEAYAHYNRPVVAIPGNHDGDPAEGGSEPSLASFVRYFCDSSPRLLPEVEEYGRDTMTQPNVYWTLVDPLVTIIGLYSNVPSGGRIEADQAAWLKNELAAAPKDVALIVALHHPPYSCDAHHGGSAEMGKLLDEAFGAAGRCPDLVLSGHVHDYQRFSRMASVPGVNSEGNIIPYVVCGAGGYHNLHGMAKGAVPGVKVTQDCTLEAFSDKEWGFLRLWITPPADGYGHIAGEYVGVGKDGTVTPGVDKFTVPVKPVM